MTWQALFTLAVIALMVVGLVRYAHVSDVIFMGALTLFAIVGIITPGEAVAGFKNEGMLTVGALFVVAAGLVNTGVLTRVTRRVLGPADDSRTALRRLVPPITLGSAFLNNTTVVAMSMPGLLEWARKRGVAPSRLLLPLSYAAILGGVCTLIGTSTNLVVHGLMQESGVESLRRGLSMLELTWVGLPIAVVGGLYLVVVAPRLLPDRKEFLEQLGETRREYLAEIIVEPNCPLIGKTVQEAGLRGLPGLFLLEIERSTGLVSPVDPDQRITAGDRLVFTGVVSTIVDLQKTPGLTTAADTIYEIRSDRRRGRRLCEAVISTSSPLVGRGIREANFRTIYDAAVVAVHRNGQRLRQKIGDIRLEPGDTLLLETGAGFIRGHRNNPDFFLVSDVGDAAPVRHERAGLALAVAGLLVLALTLPEILLWLPPLRVYSEWFADQRAIFAMLAAGLMVLTRSVSASDARRSIDWNVLLTIAASFGVGTAMSRSGAAALVAEETIHVFHALGPVGVLAGVYVLTWVLTELMSNNAAAALMFPIAVATAQAVGVEPRVFVIAVALGASAGFIFPVGYQTHLMVFGPGGYRVSDFVKVGLPMVAIWLVMTLLLVPYFWSLDNPIAGGAAR